MSGHALIVHLAGLQNNLTFNDWPPPNYVNPYERTWLPPIVIVLWIIATVFFALRIILRIRGIAGLFGIDDVSHSPSSISTDKPGHNNPRMGSRYCINRFPTGTIIRLPPRKTCLGRTTPELDAYHLLPIRYRHSLPLQHLLHESLSPPILPPPR